MITYWRQIASLCLVATTVLACKQVGGGGSDAPQFDEDGDPVSASTERNASASTEIHSRGKFFYQVWNQPMITKYGDLHTAIQQQDGSYATSVTPEKMPYSGGYYPEKDGGTNVGVPSALKKYDDLFYKGVATAVKWEIENHTRPGTDPDAGWAGHCNGFSAASSRHKEPNRDVVRGNVTFKPWDVKALLAELYMSDTDVFLAGVRCEDNSSARPDPTKMGACEDSNPGSFHLTMANWIGRMKHPLIADFAANHEVWNYPVYKFTVHKDPDPNKVLSKAEANSKINAGNTSSTYTFNPAAVSFRHVKATIEYANAFGAELRTPAPNLTAVAKTYEYILELNDQDEIIGGEWIGTSKNAHPDFVWAAFEPYKSTGVKTFGNPHLDINEVMKIWAESIGADPNNPPASIKLPEWRNNWGKFPNFDVTLDGSSTGAVFLGKKIKMSIKRKNKLAGNVTLEFGINDRGIVQKTDLSGDGVHEIEIDPIVGINRLAFVWKRSGVEVEPPSFARFHALP